jgi:hypothetical protein
VAAARNIIGKYLAAMWTEIIVCLNILITL